MLSSNGVSSCGTKDTSNEGISTTTKTPVKKASPEHVYMVDLENAIVTSLSQEVAGRSLIDQSGINALQQYVQMLVTYFPGKPTMMKFLDKFNTKIRNLTSFTDGVEISDLIKEISTVESKLPAKRPWAGCRGSIEGKRGYPCSLWMLFHTCTVNAIPKIDGKKDGEGTDKASTVYSNTTTEALLENATVTTDLWASTTDTGAPGSEASPTASTTGETLKTTFNDNGQFTTDNTSNSEMLSLSTLNGKEYTVLRAIHGYVKNFFGCRECSQHFQEMGRELNLQEVSTPEDGALWLWNAHNVVNARLAGDATEDPSHPKIQFPSKNMCPTCRKSKVFSTKPTLKFLLKFYSPNNIL